MTCTCGRTPDPGICPLTHDGYIGGGHCTCAHETAVPVSSPPPDQTALVDAGAAAIWALYPDVEPSRTGLVLANPHAVAAAVLTVLPPPADRTAVLREAADFAEQLMDERYGPDCSYGIGGLDVARGLRRLAAEVQQPDTETRP